jgi:predicted CXXCH cytochrome family protein
VFHSRLLYLTAFWLVSQNVWGAGAHPTRVDAKSNCVECHADYAKGTYVHAAVKQGCTICHTVEQREDSTYVGVKSTKTVICAECHQSQQFLRVHFPYASSMCTRCHNPHASPYPRLMRAKVNDLCLQCHLRTATRVGSQDLPTITLTLNNTMGHPYERHPVSGTLDPLTGGEMSCTSCHLAHGGTMLHHLRMGSEVPEDALNQNTETKDMCHKCHLRMWGLDSASAKKKKKSR